MLRDGADHVEAGRLCKTGRSTRIGPAVFGEIELDPLQPLLGVEIARPLPGRDGEMDRVVLRRHAELFGPAPGDRTNVGIRHAVLVDHQLLGRVDLGDRIRDFEIEDIGRLLQPLRMLGALEDFAAIGALAFKHGAGVMQTMGQQMNLRLGTGDELAVEPDQTWQLIEGHGHRLPPWRSSGQTLIRLFCLTRPFPLLSDPTRRAHRDGTSRTERTGYFVTVSLSVTIFRNYVNSADLNNPRSSACP